MNGLNKIYEIFNMDVATYLPCGTKNISNYFLYVGILKRILCFVIIGSGLLLLAVVYMGYFQTSWNLGVGYRRYKDKLLSADRWTCM